MNFHSIFKKAFSIVKPKTTDKQFVHEIIILNKHKQKHFFGRIKAKYQTPKGINEYKAQLQLLKLRLIIMLTLMLNMNNYSEVRLSRIKNKQIRAVMVRICLSWLLLLDLNQ